MWWTMGVDVSCYMDKWSSYATNQRRIIGSEAVEPDATASRSRIRGDAARGGCEVTDDALRWKQLVLAAPSSPVLRSSGRGPERSRRLGEEESRERDLCERKLRSGLGPGCLKASRSRQAKAGPMRNGGAAVHRDIP